MNLLELRPANFHAKSLKRERFYDQNSRMCKSGFRTNWYSPVTIAGEVLRKALPFGKVCRRIDDMNDQLTA